MQHKHHATRYRRLRAPIAVMAAAALIMACRQSASAATIDFESLLHGEIVTTQFVASHGVTISAVNYNRWHDLAIIFDSMKDNTRDPDLEGPTWSGGNLASGMELGNMLIISENSRQSVPGIIANPDDEGGRPAGKLIFDFAAPITSFGFDLIDVESIMAEDGYVRFYNQGMNVGLVGFAEFTNAANPNGFFKPGVAFGNNSANRIEPITAAALNTAGFDRVVINLGGSGAVDNITYVPEPGTLILLAMGAVYVLTRFRRIG